MAYNTAHTLTSQGTASFKKQGFKNEYYFMIPNSFYKKSKHTNLISGCYITNIGYFPRALHHYRERPNGAEDYVFFYCAAGAGMIQINNGRKLSFTQGQVIVLPANIAHVYYSSDENPWDLFWVHLSGTLMDNLWLTQNLSTPKYITLHSCVQMEMFFNNCFETLKKTYTEMDYFYVCQLMSCALGIACSSATTAPVSQESESIVHVLDDYMKKHLGDTITLAELSDVCNYSPSYISQLFKQYRQCTPIHYFNEMKIKAAAKELYFSKDSIKTISEKYGFSDPLYFSRAFHNTFGISPREYRNKLPG